MAKNKITLKDLFRRLQAKRVVATSSDPKRAAIEYSVILTADEYDQLEKQAGK